MLLLLRDATIARYMYPIIHINPTHSSKRRRLGGYISPPPASAKESTSLCTHLLIDRETNSLLCEMRSSTLVGITPIGGNGWTLREEYPLVQSRCNYSVVDTYTIAEVIQDYYSNAPINRDVEYVFPLPPSAAVCSFKAIVDDTQIIKGVVKEKVEAKKAYDKAVAQGKTAGLLRQEHADVFRVSLGNIRPKTKISVHISFVSIVPHDGSSPQTLRITMPTAIAPRYGTAPTDIPWFGNNVQSRFELSVSVQMNKPITSISSPSHPIGLTLGCHQRELTGDYEPSKAFVHLGTPTMLDQDIVILISAQGMETPRCSVERWLKSEGAEETTDAYALTLVPKFELPALPRQEYIFLVDRSGSMEGGRITAVKAALQILLRSLPSFNTRFNIISFGSHYTSLWPESQLYTAESMDEASRHVEGFNANYGGTELRSALDFAFSSRIDIKNQLISMSLLPATTAMREEKVPTSVFVLTDGEAWDVDRIVQSVEGHCRRAKDDGSLLRTFVLGVGNQVSTAMCEGIARAGKGLSVFVAERERPDAKLMGLIKAARGGVIEDLVIDWGDSEEEEDGFEVVQTSNASGGHTSSRAPSRLPPPPPPPQQQQQPPLSLFDELSTVTLGGVGPLKAIEHLGPPPKVQQAPNSNKLPIPLYPGFRCSIFAIIKRNDENPGPHPDSVKITGKVMGRDVVLQVPLSPVTTMHSGVVEGKVEGGKLLHTLAARALIQAFEDLPKTPRSKAEIERLGKRYSLASSVTSFVAIGDTVETEPVEPLPTLFGQWTGVTPARGRPNLADQLQLALNQRTSKLAIDSDDDGEWDEVAEADEESSSEDDRSSRSALATSLFSGAVDPVLPPLIPQPTGMPAQYAGSLRLEREAEKVRSIRRRPPPPPPRLARASSSAPAPAPAAPRTTSNATCGPSFSFAMSTQSPGGSKPAAGNEPWKVLSVEWIARTQRFDGSFPSNKEHFVFLFKGDETLATSALESLPSALLLLFNGNNAEDGLEEKSKGKNREVTRMTIWATVVTLMCLETRFAEEKSAWELLAEKAREFIKSVLLHSLGLEEAKAREALVQFESSAIPLFEQKATTKRSKEDDFLSFWLD